MKIIISPSKTQDHTNPLSVAMHTPFYNEKAMVLNKKLNTHTQKSLKKIMNIDGQLFDETWHNIKNFQDNGYSPVIHTYTGLVYKYLNLKDYDPSMLAFMDQHLVILSAMYGALRPLDGIRPYRLDMKMQIMTKTLYEFWQKDLESYFKGETIIDLASTEFSKMISLPKTTIGFRDFKDGKYKNLATYAKMARGILLDLIIKQEIDCIDDLLKLEFAGYHYNEALSKENLIIYTRYD